MKTLAETRRELGDALSEAGSYFDGLSNEELFRHRPGAWAPIDDLAHLNLTTGLTARSLGLPPLELAARFGRAERPSRTWDEVRQAYLETLAAGFRSPERFVPREAGTRSEKRRSRTLVEWRAVGEALLRALDGWDEGEVDSYVVPHPALGDLTVRELLFFTHIHVLHHVAVARRRVAGG